MKIARKHLLLAGGIVAGVSVLATALGQSRPAQPAATKVAVCDVVEILGNCQQSTDLNAELLNRRKAMEIENQKREKAAKDLEQELRGLDPESDQYEKRQVELEKMRADNDNWWQLQERQLQRWYVKVTKEVYQKIIVAVAQVADERGAQLVLYKSHLGLVGQDVTLVMEQISRRSVLYSESSVDVTAAVLTRLNDQYHADRASRAR
ncbi:MAG TPA: OmpH family outer membrane protein [Phycisphaerae bacterium]|nr:OmpH family outer membrane protein [Phycisphaerae bacterium]